MIHSLFLKVGLSILTSAAISSGAMGDTKVASVATVKTEKVAAEKPTPVSIPRANNKMKFDKHGMLLYPHSKRNRHVRTTAYSHMEGEDGAPGRKNAIGTRLVYTKKLRSAAADWSVYPVGTKFKIKGQSQLFIVDDYGSALAGTGTLDIYNPTLHGMRKWGTRKVEIEVVEWGSYERSLKILSGRTRHWHCRQMHDAIKKKLESGKYAQM